MSVIITPGAKADLTEAARWYAEQEAGLEIRFAFAVELALRRIEDSPVAFAVFHGALRKVRVKPFAYILAYEVRGIDVVVHAAIHVRRGPEQIERQLNRPQ